MTTERGARGDSRSCIDECNECHAVCIETVAYCLERVGRRVHASHLRLLLDCADIGRTSAEFMLRGSELHVETRAVCADVCERCAERCDTFDDDERMRRCAEVCRRLGDAFGSARDRADDLRGGRGAHECALAAAEMGEMGGMAMDCPAPDDGQALGVQSLLPEYMSMGNAGIGEMADMHGIPVPQNSIPMLGGRGPFGAIDMGGMFTLLKVRKELTSYEDPGWYAHPTGTVAAGASRDELRAAGI